MENLAKNVVEKLFEKGKTISVMESCTGGGFANSITNIPGSSNVFKFGAVTYSNEFKVKMGVDEKILNKFSVYSKHTAKEMSKKIVEFSGADYGVGITGKLKKVDPQNGFGEDDVVFFCVFDKNNNKFFDGNLIVTKNERKDNKEMVIFEIFRKILSFL